MCLNGVNCVALALASSCTTPQSSQIAQQQKQPQSYSATCCDCEPHPLTYFCHPHTFFCPICLQAHLQSTGSRASSSPRLVTQRLHVGWKSVTILLGMSKFGSVVTPFQFPALQARATQLASGCSFLFATIFCFLTATKTDVVLPLPAGIPHGHLAKLRAKEHLCYRHSLLLLPNDGQFASKERG